MQAVVIRARRRFGPGSFGRKAGLRFLSLYERARFGAVLDPRAPAVRNDPAAVYHTLRRRDPVHWSELLQEWVLTRYDDILTLLKDDRFVSSYRTALGLPPRRRIRNVHAAFERSIIRLDDDEHTKVRAIIAAPFSTRRIEALAPDIQGYVDGLLDALPPNGEADLIPALAVPLPLMVIAALLGCPLSDVPRFREWSRIMTPVIVDPIRDGASPHEANRAATEARDYFREHLDRRRAGDGPPDDLLGLSAAAVARGDLSEDDALSTLLFLLVAGNETTANLIGQAIRLVLLHPETAAAREGPRLEAVIEEALRLETPIQGLRRAARDDVTLDGKCIRRGQPVRVLFAAANRDPAHFPDPDAFRPGRDGDRHLAFGYGAHYCLGAGLSRLEARLALETLFRRYPRLALLDDRPPLRDMMFVRGLESLRVRLA